jgi:hydrogenase nickel incorporation protein HypA/HybF
MHEVGIVTQALDMALEAAKKENAARITLMRMRIGDLAGVVPEALEFAFSVVTRETIAEGAKFEWDAVPVLCRCDRCQKDFTPDAMAYRCPDCGELATKILSGREIEVTEIEVETADE